MSILQYFKENYPKVEKLGDITWSHAVNSWEKAGKYIDNPDIMFIESDVRISEEGEIIMAHPPSVTSDLTFAAMIGKMVAGKQGLKLDFKDPQTLIPCLEFLQKVNLQKPVMLNADILKGSSALDPRFDAMEFISLAIQYFPQGILSLGWTSTVKSFYLKENIDEMLNLCSDIKLDITFPVRACLLPQSWPEVKRLLKRDNHTLTVWNNEPVLEELQVWIKENTDQNRTFYDFIDEDKNPIRFW